ncbi:MAG: hypothetical protein ABI183_03290 [Polyangiaceae bacterium]
MTALRLRLALASSWFLVSATFLYALVRGIQKILFPEANPATIIWSAHAGYFWRIWIVLYASGVVAFLVFRFSRAHSENLAKWLKAGVIVAAIAILIQGIFIP